MQYQDWTFSLSPGLSPGFSLVNGSAKPITGELEITNNGSAIPVADIDWRFRYSEGRVEQWCQLQHSQTLSININYHFAGDALIIEYLARNTVPTRMHIRHRLVFGESPLVEGDAVTMAKSGEAQCQYQHIGLPSESLSRSAKSALFREAFSAQLAISLEM